MFHYTLREMQGDLDWQQESSDGSLRYSTLVFLGLDYTYEIYLDGELQVPLEEDLAVEEGHTFDNMMRVYIQREDGQWKVTDLQWANYYSVSDLEDPYSMQ